MVSGLLAGAFAVIATAFGITLSISAPSTIVVTPANTQGWHTADTRPGGAVNFVADAGAPGGSAALQLTTTNVVPAKAQYLHDAGTTSLSAITVLGYHTKQNSTPFAGGAASYQLPMFLNATSGFTTLVFEPYQNPLQGAVTSGVWQEWDVDAGLFWSTRTVTCSNGTITGVAGGPANYTLAQVLASCPDAVILAYGVNIGSNNPSYDVLTDLLDFNGLVYDFELVNTPTSKDQCKGSGYLHYTDSNNQPFKNQGQCVKFVEHL